MLINKFYNDSNSFSFTNSKYDVTPSSKAGRKKAYWISQAAGWGAVAIINSVAAASFYAFSWKRIILIICMCGFGVLLTHLYRAYITKYEWKSLPLKKIIPRVLLASLSIGTLLYLFIFTTNTAFGITDFERFQWVTPLFGILNLSSIILIWTLIYFSVHYFENYKKAEIESLIWEAAVKDFELKTLKSQLNPHFMFNALNSIRALIKIDPANAQAAVTHLSNLLRYSLKIERNETVPLEEEIQTVKDYLALEKIRFEERLMYNFSIDESSLKIEIPPMMIQTLVENGIKHGISRKQEGGEISISTKVKDSVLIINIENSGDFDPAALQASTGFGISNTKHRLNLLYGEKGLFKIQTINENKVSVEIKIPTGGTIR